MPLYRQMVGDTTGASMLIGKDDAGNAIMTGAVLGPRCQEAGF